MAFDRSTPFRAKIGLAAGFTLAQLNGPRFRRLHRGVYVDASADLDLVARCRAALHVLPKEALFSRHTAAELWGGIVPARSRLTATVPFRSSARQPSIETTRSRRMPEGHRRRGLPVTSPERTFLDIAASLDLVDLVVLGDSLVRRNVTTPAKLIAAARDFTGPRTAVARRAAALVRGGVDSPMETRLRLLIVLAGLPEPTVNHIVRGERGEWTYRFDLSYPELKIAIEYDGRQHAESTEQWVRDVGRREDLDNRGWRLLVVLSGDVFTTPATTLDRICELLRERGALVKLTSHEWKAHFPGRAAARLAAL